MDMVRPGPPLRADRVPSMSTSTILLTVTEAVVATDQDGTSFWLAPSLMPELALRAGDIDEQVDPEWVVAYWGDRRFVLPDALVELLP